MPHYTTPHPTTLYSHAKGPLDLESTSSPTFAACEGGGAGHAHHSSPQLAPHAPPTGCRTTPSQGLTQHTSHTTCCSNAKLSYFNAKLSYCNAKLSYCNAKLSYCNAKLSCCNVNASY